MVLFLGSAVIIALIGAFIWMSIQAWAARYPKGLALAIFAEFSISAAILAIVPGIPFMGIVAGTILLTLILNSISAFIIFLDAIDEKEA